MNYIRNFFGGWDAQKNIDSAQPNKVEKEVDGSVIIDSPINEPEPNSIFRALNTRNMSNNIVSGIKKITSGVLDIVNCANLFNKTPVNNKTPQRKADILSDNKNIQNLTEKVKLYYTV